LRQASDEKSVGKAAQSKSWRKILLKAMPDPGHAGGAGKPVKAARDEHCGNDLAARPDPDNLR